MSNNYLKEYTFTPLSELRQFNREQGYYSPTITHAMGENGVIGEVKAYLEEVIYNYEVNHVVDPNEIEVLMYRRVDIEETNPKFDAWAHNSCSYPTEREVIGLSVESYREDSGVYPWRDALRHELAHIVTWRQHGEHEEHSPVFYEALELLDAPRSRGA